MKYIPIDSFGKCLNNARLPSTIEYEADYVTEKFYIPLMAGAVPVYKGAPNIRDFAPDYHSFISVDDFDGPEELASYLTALHEDPLRCSLAVNPICSFIIHFSGMINTMPGEEGLGLNDF
eukprot:750533-Hanusia_phi.AAC.2